MKNLCVLLAIVMTGGLLVAGCDSEPTGPVYGTVTRPRGEYRLVYVSRMENFPGDNPFGPPIWNIFMTTMKGEGRLQLTVEGGYNPALNSVRRQVAYEATINGRTQIYVMDWDGGRPRPVRISGASDEDPEFSPDGLQIVFCSGQGGNRNIYVINVNGGAAERLTNSTGFNGHPVFSPDGSRIAFTSDRGGNLNIYTMSVDGTDLKRLTNNRSSDSRPAFSPDGSMIAFVSDRDAKDGEIFVMNPDGTDQRRLETGGVSETDPTFSAGGSQIAFSSHRDGDWDVYIMNLDGTELKNLTLNGDDDRLAAIWHGQEEVQRQSVKEAKGRDRSNQRK